MSENSGQQLLVRARFNFQQTNEDELTFEKGDIIGVTRQEEGGWWEGMFNGRTGWFPSNYVREVKGSGKYLRYLWEARHLAVHILADCDASSQISATECDENVLNDSFLCSSILTDKIMLNKLPSGRKHASLVLLLPFQLDGNSSTSVASRSLLWFVVFFLLLVKQSGVRSGANDQDTCDEFYYPHDVDTFSVPSHY